MNYTQATMLPVTSSVGYGVTGSLVLTGALCVGVGIVLCVVAYWRRREDAAISGE